MGQWFVILRKLWKAWWQEGQPAVSAGMGATSPKPSLLGGTSAPARGDLAGWDVLSLLLFPHLLPQPLFALDKQPEKGSLCFQQH